MDYWKKIKRKPQLKEKYRYEAIKSGKYIQKKRKFSDHGSFVANIHQESVDVDYSSEFIPNPELIPDDGKKLWIKNITDGPVVIGLGAGENRFVIEKFVHINNIPPEVKNSYGFHVLFTQKPPVLTLISDAQYRKEFAYYQKKREVEEEIIERKRAEAKNQDGNLKVGRTEGGGSSVREYIDELKSMNSNNWVVDVGSVSDEDYKPLNSAEKGLSDILNAASSNEDMSQEEINSFLRNSNL